MVDYVNIELLNIDIEKLLQSKILNFKGEISISTGEENLNILVAKYHFCEIKIKTIVPDEEHKNDPIRYRVTLTGSVHKLWNELNGIKAPNYNEKTYTGYNGNDFTINDIVKVREHLEHLLDFNSNQMVFHGVEFGVNPTPNFNPKLYVKGLLYHRDVLFDFTHNNNSAQADHQRWKFKIYNKSIQYGMSYYVSRVELKITRMIEIKSTGIKTFADINENTIKKATEVLLNRFDELMHYDYTIDKSKLSKTDLKNIKEYSNPRYWIYDIKPNRRDRPKQNLKSITLKYSDNLHQQIRTKIIEKCVIINRLSESSNCVINNTSSIQFDLTQNTPKNGKKIYSKNDKVKNAICPVTGLNLCNEKEGTKYALTTTLQKFKESDPETFEVVRIYLLSKFRSRPKFEQSEISHLAKQIRNIYYNPFKIKQKGYNQPVHYFQYSQLNFLNILGI
ncbi:hypothetical protein ACFX5D_01375 [Flavobacterium sp. LB3P45]|uniref:Uncharacterized protein n=1 Tax=Flavobacterium fructosi TaxID=3230416 RepID=A0ABW6HHX1_9FLAO